MFAVTALVAGRTTNEAEIVPGVIGVMLCGISWMDTVRSSDELIVRWVSDGLFISMAGSIALIVIGVMALVESRRGRAATTGPARR
ncbi:hypothetical protein [Nonomuraea sp. KM88]